MTKIVIIEHNLTDIELIRHELEKSDINYTAEIVKTEIEYEDVLRNFKPNIILSNYTFPDFDGLTAFKLKQKLAPQTPFIFVSNSIGEENAVEAIKNGVTDFVLKEQISTLNDKVTRAIKKAVPGKSIAELNQKKEKRSEELYQNETKFRDFFENSIDGFLLLVTDGEILAANPALCKMFQKTEQEIINAGKFGFVDQTDPRFELFLEECKRTGKAKGVLTLLRKDGSRFPAELSSTVFEDAFGEKRTSMIIRDITERKETDEKLAVTSNDLQKTLNGLKKILDSSSDVVCSFDEEGRFVHINCVSEYIWGYKPQELIGRKYIDFVFHGDVENTLNTAIDSRNDISVTMFENRYIHKNGNIVPMLWSSIWDDVYKLSYCIAKDISDKKNLEKDFEFEKQQFNNLYSQAPSCMGILKGPDYVFEMANPLYLQLIAKKDIIGKTIKEVLPELEGQGCFKFLEEVYKTGETFSANERLVKFDRHGSGILVDTYLNFIYQAHKNKDGVIDGILFFAVDVTEQVVSRKRIEENKKRFRTLIEKSEEMILLTNEEGKLLYSSPSVNKNFGFSLEDLTCQSVFDYVHPDDLASLLEKIQKIITTPGKSFYHQQRIRHKNGKWIWCENTITNRLHEPGIHALITNLRDITEKKIIEEQGKFDKNNLNALINNTNDLMWSVDRNFKLITYNEPFNKIIRLNSGQAIEKGSDILASNVPMFLLNHYKASCERAFAGESFSEIEYQETPTEKWFEISYYPIRKGNEIIGTACYSRNITESKKAALILEHRNKELANYKFALDETLIVTITDQKGNIKYVNDNFCKISQYSCEELIGQHHIIISTGYHSKEYINNLMKTITDGKTWKGEINNKAKDGTIYWVDTTITPFLDEQGKPYQYVVAQFDITDRKNAELNLEQQNKELIKTNIELDQFVYSVSHDLRSPLTSILGLLSFIEEESKEDDTLQHVEMIRNSINRQDKFIKNILSYSRNNRTVLEIKRIPLRKIANEVVNSLRRIKEAADIDFEINIQEQWPFYSDSLRFNTILENIVSNAIKYRDIDRSSYIKITGQCDGEKLQLSIADNGIGIASEYHDKIFEMFFRIVGKIEGSGIGLYIVKNTIEMLQGSIQVQSQEGTGTTFIITLKNLKP